MGAQQFSMAVIYPSCTKADLLETRDNDTITRKVHVDGKNFAMGKNGGYMLSSLAIGQLVWAGSE